MWGKKFCDSNPNTALKDVIGNFLEYIQFHKIPANVLMREVHPLGLVPYSIIMNALAYQVMQSIPFVKSWQWVSEPLTVKNNHFTNHLHEPQTWTDSLHERPKR
jgi:hypothetical protein